MPFKAILGDLDWKISVTSKMVKKVIMNLDSSKASGPDCFSSGGSKELLALTFIHTSWTLQYMSQRVLFSRSLEGLIIGTYI